MLDDHQIMLGAWEPDKGEYGGTHLLDARNVLATHQGYVSASDLQPFTGALMSEPLGYTSIYDDQGTVHYFAADSKRLYKLGSDDNWDVLNTFTGTLSDGLWHFITHGNYVYALSALEPIRRFDLNSGTTFETITGIPTAKYGAVVRDHGVIGGIPNNQQRVQWSAYLDLTDWEASAATQSGFHDLPSSLGTVQAVVTGDYGVIFQTNAIWRMESVDPPIVFQFDIVEPERGTNAPYSVCRYGREVYYYGHDGFYRFDGQRSTPIGTGKIDEWFRSQNADVNSLYGVVDVEKKRILWAFSRGLGAGRYDTILAYSWDIQQWSYIRLDLDFLGGGLTRSVTLESDAYEGEPDSIDDPSDQTSFDSDIFQGSNEVVTAFNTDYEMGYLNGSALSSRLQTCFAGQKNKQPMFVNSARPIVDWGIVPPETHTDLQAALELTVRTQDFPRADLKTKEATLARTGDMQFRTKGRLFQYDLTFNRGFEQCTEMAVRWRVAGKR